MLDFDRDYSMTIGGAALPGRRKFKAWNPANRRVIARVPEATQGQLDQAVAAA